MKYEAIALSLALCFSVVLVPCKAQVKPDTSFVASSRVRAEQLYGDFIKGQSRLYSGSEFKDYIARNDEYPFFGVDDWTSGDLLYDGVTYKDVGMLYDLSQDVVAVEQPYTGAKIQLIGQRIAWFTLGDKRFVRLLADTSEIIKEGFYQVLHQGATGLYARHEKTLQENIESQQIVARFEEKHRYYIYKGGCYYPVKNLGSTLDVLADQKAELKAYLRKNKIRFRKNREGALVKLVTYYDSPKP